MTYLCVPAGIMKAFGGRTRVPVKATLNGFTYRTTIAQMGMGAMIGVRAEVRTKAGIAKNDMVEVELEEDTEKRSVTIPKDLKAVLSPAQLERFKKFPYSHQREYVEAIEDAKKPETRQRRIAKTIEMIQAKM